jgi:hypothetical protein
MSLPNAPTSVAGFPSNGAAAFTFTSGGGGAATQYDIYLSSDTGFATSYGNGTASPIKTSTALTNGTSYSFVVVASNGAGRGPASAVVTVTPATTVTIGAFTDPLLDNTTYNMNANLTITSTVQVQRVYPFPVLGSGTGITFNGNGNTITIISTQIRKWYGLFEKWVDVNNLGILLSGARDPNIYAFQTELYTEAGELTAGWFFAFKTGGTATDCYSNGYIKGFTISGVNLGHGGGGIFGSYCDFYAAGKTVSATRCYSTGEITAGCGGIFGAAAGCNATSTVIATDCYSTGSMGNDSGGIFARNCGVTNGATVTALRCRSTGALNGRSGGIFGWGTRSGSNTTISIINCYSTGAIANGCAGIIAETGSFQQIRPIIITNCYSTGAIGSSQAGGIVGQGKSKYILTNCFATGSLGTSTTSGMLWAGGTFSGFAYSPVDVTAVNCYYVGSTPGPTGVAGTVYTLTNTGGSASAWSDSDANTYLTGHPEDTVNPRVWYRVLNTTNTAYLLSLVTGPPAFTSATAGDASANLSWTTPTTYGLTIILYNVYISTNGTTYTKIPSANITRGSLTATTVTVTGLTNGTAYTFYVTTVDNAAESYPSAVSSSVTPTAAATAAGVPVIVAPFTTTSTTVVVAWTNGDLNGNASVANDVILCSSDGTVITTYTGVSSPYTVTVSPGSTNFFKIAARGNVVTTAVYSVVVGSLGYVSAPIAVAQHVVNNDTAYYSKYLLNAASASEGLIALRAAIKPLPSLGNRGISKTQALAALRTKYGSSITLSSGADGTGAFLDTFDSKVTGLSTSIPTIVILPTYTLSSGNYTAAHTISDAEATAITAVTSYVVYELPVSTAGVTYTLTLTYGAASVPLTYDGTVLRNGATTYSAGGTLVVGALSIPLLGLGSFGAGGGNGGGGADPYVTTFSNISYKLPALDAPIRYFQTMESGKLLTINAQLKTVERSDMADDTLRSLLMLRKKMTTKQYINIIHKLMEPETLCFFERISIQYGEQRLVVNLWNSKFELVENTLRCGVEKVDRPDLLKKAGGIYDGYKGETVKLTLGGTSVFLSVYDSPMIRNGITIESRSLKEANGVIVNALSPGAMTLRSLASVEPVSTCNSLKASSRVETFVDHDGVRSRNIVTYK